MMHFIDIHRSTNDTMLPHGLSAYVEKNSWHFTRELAEWAIARLDNIAKPIVPEGINDRLSWDEIYTANMAKSDFSPAILRDDKACVAYAKAVSNDSDGYDGMIFKRWLTDCGGRGIQINWDLFI